MTTRESAWQHPPADMEPIPESSLPYREYPYSNVLKPRIRLNYTAIAFALMAIIGVLGAVCAVMEGMQ